MTIPAWICTSETHVGTVRKVNEDSYLSNPQHNIWCVADGMGGHARGDLASQLIIEDLSSLLEQAKTPLNLTQISTCIQVVNTALFDMSKMYHSVVGSTLAILKIDAQKVHCIWAGDSRIYRVRNGQIMRLTRDHSQVEDMVDAGLISAHEAETHPNANIITRAVGAHEELELEVKTFDLQKNDRFILCSDGLNKVMSDIELEHYMHEYPFNELAEKFIATSLARNARDNVTVIAVQHEQYCEDSLKYTLPLDATLPLTRR